MEQWKNEKVKGSQNEKKKARKRARETNREKNVERWTNGCTTKQINKLRFLSDEIIERTNNFVSWGCTDTWLFCPRLHYGWLSWLDGDFCQGWLLTLYINILLFYSRIVASIPASSMTLEQLSTSFYLNFYFALLVFVSNTLTIAWTWNRFYFSSFV